MDELYTLYRPCFPDYPAAEAVFRECLKRERGQVLYGAEWLKSRGCTGVELRYVELVNWYRRIGFTVTRRQWMGERRLPDPLPHN